MEENNQNNPELNLEVKETPKSASKWKFYVVCVGILLTLGLIIYIQYNNNQDNKRAAEIFENLYLQETKSKVNLESRLDSAQAAIKILSGYWSLTSIMIDRDNARKNLKYQPGDFVIMKVDSSKVLIVDIIAGGDTYNYTLQYEIQKSDKTYERVSPKLLY